MTRVLIYLPIFLAIARFCNAVAKFEPISVTDSSLVIRMVEASTVQSFDMTVQIFDLDRLVEYRKTELRGSTKDQLFSFDGLTTDTWFAFRIHYSLQYEHQPNAVEVDAQSDMKRKQELIIRTKGSQRQDPSKINDTIAYLDDLFITKDNIYIGVASVFKDTKKVITVIVPELKCSKGVLKPLAQQVVHSASFHFDLTLLGEPNVSCSRICVFPFVRVAIQNRTSETFRGKEWCGGIEEAKKLVKSSSISCFIVLLSIYLLFTSW